jgi:hypothetical protein
MTNKTKELEDEIDRLEIQENKYELMLSQGKAVPLKGTIDLSLLKAELKGRQEARKETFEEVKKMIIEWHGLGNNKWQYGTKESYVSMDNAVQDLLKQLEKSGEKE